MGDPSRAPIYRSIRPCDYGRLEGNLPVCGGEGLHRWEDSAHRPLHLCDPHDEAASRARGDHQRPAVAGKPHSTQTPILSESS